MHVSSVIQRRACHGAYHKKTFLKLFREKQRKSLTLISPRVGLFPSFTPDLLCHHDASASLASKKLSPRAASVCVCARVLLLSFRMNGVKHRLRSQRVTQTLMEVQVPTSRDKSDVIKRLAMLCAVRRVTSCQGRDYKGI